MLLCIQICSIYSSCRKCWNGKLLFKADNVYSRLSVMYDNLHEQFGKKLLQNLAQIEGKGIFLLQGTLNFGSRCGTGWMPFVWDTHTKWSANLGKLWSILDGIKLVGNLLGYGYRELQWYLLDIFFYLYFDKLFNAFVESTLDIYVYIAKSVH